jgi:hypothetical protein
MLRRILLVCIPFVVATPCLWAQDTSPARSQGCSSKELTALLTPTDPVYAESVELTQELENRGYVVRCVLQSKWASFFHGQLGAALYRTSRGDFEALFLTKPQTFDSVRLLERQQNGRYLYSFEGSPRPSSASPIDSNRRTFFAKRSNRFFIAWDSMQLATDLGELLNSA